MYNTSIQLLDFNHSELARTANFENMDRTHQKLTPTETVSRELQALFSYGNRCFFNARLPECMLTVDQPGRCAYGYFSPFSFVSKSGDMIHQISINPLHLLNRPLKNVFSTVVHEQCHLWEFETAKRKTCTGYHNKRWATKMESIGLIPSHTGQPGGSKTGYRMTHYIEAGGWFDQSADALVHGQFGLSWGLATHAMRETAFGTGKGKKPDGGKTPDKTDKKDRSKGKVKFICPTCHKPCWAAPSRKLICGDDLARMQKVSP